MITETQESLIKLLNKLYAQLDNLNYEMRKVLEFDEHNLDKLLNMSNQYMALTVDMIRVKNYIARG